MSNNGYKGAILIIGSLCWDNQRSEWRDARLDTTSKVLVSAPIRYGRKSSSRSNTYTMILSNSCYENGMGTALVVPLKKNVVSFDDLLDEAAEAWKAESLKQNLSKNDISSNWGTIALLINPAIKLKDDILSGWKIKHFQDKGNKPNIKYADNEKPIILDDGMLNIEWINRIDNGQPLEFDFILAAVTEPKPNNAIIPTPYEIAQAILKSGYKEYFINNQENNITTYQDEEIVAYLSE